jgi:hypothetical protein
MDERELVARRYGEHLTEQDLLALAGGRAEAAKALRWQPTLLLDLLDRPSVTEALLTRHHGEPERFRYLSPFLVFAAAVHRVGATLAHASYVPDRTGLRSRLPVFDGPALAAFAAEPTHRLFLAELLASYSRVASGVVWEKTERGRPRRRRWDELDLPGLAHRLNAAPAPARPALWQRLGDGAVFLSGVFPEYAERALGLVEVDRLQRATGLRPRDASGPVSVLLEEVARLAYRQAGAAVPTGVRNSPASARRVIALVADTYLYPVTPDWLAAPGE